MACEALAPTEGVAALTDEDGALMAVLVLALDDAGGDAPLPVAVIAVLLLVVPALGVPGVRALCVRNGIIA